MPRPITGTHSTKTQREIPPPKTFLARCRGVVDLGTQPDFGEFPQPKLKVHLMFELVNTRHVFKGQEDKGEQPFVISVDFPRKMSKKANLRKFIVAWFGKDFLTEDAARDFDLFLLIGKTCQITIKHTPDKEQPEIKYANIGSISPVIEEMRKSVPPLVNPTHAFSINDLNDPEPEYREAAKKAFNALSEWLQNKIKGSPEWIAAEKGIVTPPQAVATADPYAIEEDTDDTPF